MSATPTLTTQLQAVNRILYTVGEAPVNSLTGTLPNDVQIAYDTFNEVLVEVQTRGWGFNTEYKVTMTPNTNGLITLGRNVLKITAWNMRNDIDIQQRGTNLYDRKNHTFVFSHTNTLYCNVTYALDWDSLPEQARRYILIKAARLFQTRVVGSDTLYTFTEAEEMQALADLCAADDENTQYSVFDNYDTYSIVNRYHGFAYGLGQ